MILWVLSGLPGAGKSTMARSISDDRGAIMISRDEIRATFRNLACEVSLSRMLVCMARGLLREELSVVVDAWNLHPSDEEAWRELALVSGAELRWIHIDTPTEVCVTRDSTRPNPNGAQRVRDTAATWEPRMVVLREMSWKEQA